MISLMPYLPLSIIFGIAALILLVLFLRQYLAMQDAQLKANQIIQQAQTAAIKITATDKASVETISRQALAQTEQQFKTYLQELATAAQGSLTGREQLIEQKINQLFESFEENLSSFLTQTQQQSVKSVELEMQAARQLIQTYKQQQFKLIDENIVSMLERTLSLVLVKKLSLKEQIDLVYESLEKAKAEKFIV